MIAAIVAAEIAFWVFLLAGLATRYLLRWERASRVLLICVPLVDVALLCFVGIEVARGAEPTRGHALAAVYLGVTVAFGPALIDRADARARSWWAGGPRPVKPAKGSRAAVRALWVEWFRVVLAVVVATGLLLVLIALEGRPLPGSLEVLAKDPYWGTIAQLLVVTGIWFVAGPGFAGRGRDVVPARDVLRRR